MLRSWRLDEARIPYPDSPILGAAQQEYTPTDRATRERIDRVGVPCEHVWALIKKSAKVSEGEIWGDHAPSSTRG